MCSDTLTLQTIYLAKLQGISSLCVCMCVYTVPVSWMSLCLCSELNVELLGTSNLPPLFSKDENQYSSENNLQPSSKERLGHPVPSYLDELNFISIRLKFYTSSVSLSLFFGKNTTLASQIWNTSLL